jgi:uncharacterized Zn finger protein
MPKSAPTITEAHIKRWVGATYAQRGKTYFRGGHVVDIRWRGEQLVGRVQGSEAQPYRVSILFDGKHIEGDCSCPVSYNCKHVAALLYACLDAPRRVVKTQPLDKQLAKLDKPTLVAVIKALLDDSPELDEVVEMHLEALAGPAELEDQDALRNRVRRLVQKLGDWERQSAAEQALEMLLEQARSLAEQGRRDAAAFVAQTILSELALSDPEQTGDAAAETDVALTAAEQLVEGWSAMPPESPARQEALRTLFDALGWEVHQLGTSQMSVVIEKALVKKATPDERERLREWIALASRQSATRPHRKARFDDYGYGDDDFDEDYDEDEFDDEWSDDTLGWTQQRWRALDKKLSPKPRASKPVKKRASKKPGKKRK